MKREREERGERWDWDRLTLEKRREHVIAWRIGDQLDLDYNYFIFELFIYFLLILYYIFLFPTDVRIQDLNNLVARIETD